MAMSPMMEQYKTIVEKYPDCIIFFRLGDFYEMFFEQAVLCSRELELTLTGKECGMDVRAPMCGIPYHSANIYISKLVKKGYKVAICEQLEDASTAKGLVKRDVVKIITPGTIVENEILEEDTNNFIANIYSLGKECALSFADISTGECFVTSSKDISALYKIIDETVKVAPKELVLDLNVLNNNIIMESLVKKHNIFVSKYLNQDEELLNKNILPANLSAVESKSLVLLLNYINNTQKEIASQINKIQVYKLEKYMRLDNSTRRNLEILESNRERIKKGSLLWVLDKTVTAIGARNVRKWVESPLLNKTEIDNRLFAVEALKNNIFARQDIVDLLKRVYDIERILSKVVNGSVNARDLIALKNSITILPDLKKVLIELASKSQYIESLAGNIDELKDVYLLIENAIENEPPITIKESGIIKTLYNLEVDDLRRAKTEGKNWIMALEKREREETKIKGLKVGFNRVFGYYIEITRSNFGDVPEGRYIRKQTLADKERFITPELKEIEDKILGSEEKLINLEYKLFNDIRLSVSEQIIRIQETAEVIGIIDTLCSFAIVAEGENYCMPQVTNEADIEIKDGRHPVVEKMMSENAFIANDTNINVEGNRFQIITGPNMAGKSTYMRQVALITYMAQLGSFVPSSKAKIGIVDRIFTRVGASDDLASGESTFMVEMMELSNILENATSKSMIILDEIGRGTSTFDGMSIAWATVEYIADKKKIGAKTFFATHYHELQQLEELVEGVKNYSVEVKEKGDEVIFLRKIIEGPTDDSYGIYVASLAGIPNSVVARAKKILKGLEKNTTYDNSKNNSFNEKEESTQLDIFNYKLIEVGRVLDNLNIDELTAKDALDTLYKLKEKMK